MKIRSNDSLGPISPLKKILTNVISLSPSPLPTQLRFGIVRKNSLVDNWTIGTIASLKKKDQSPLYPKSSPYIF